MQSQLVNRFVEDLNRTSRELVWEFETKPEGAYVKIGNYPSVFFPETELGGVVPRSYNWIKSKHSNGGVHEPGMLTALLQLGRLLRPDFVFFDVGSLYGYFALACNVFSPEASVIAFEMNSASADAIEFNVKANGSRATSRIRIANVALSDENSLKRRVTIDKFFLEEEEKRGVGHEVVIDIYTLDRYVRDFSLTPQVIKIDAEGYQAKIIPGALQTISQFRPVILLEFDNAEMLVSRFEKTNLEIISPLFSMGYKLIWMPDHRKPRGVFTLIEREQMTQIHERNSLAILVHESELNKMYQ